MLAGALPLHGEHVAGLVLTLPHQEVAAVLKQLLHLQSGDGTVVPVLLLQRWWEHLEAAERGDPSTLKRWTDLRLAHSAGLLLFWSRSPGTLQS